MCYGRSSMVLCDSSNSKALCVRGSGWVLCVGCSCNVTCLGYNWRVPCNGNDSRVLCYGSCGGGLYYGSSVKVEEGGSSGPRKRSCLAVVSGHAPQRLGCGLSQVVPWPKLLQEGLRSESIRSGWGRGVWTVRWWLPLFPSPRPVQQQRGAVVWPRKLVLRV